VQKRYARMMVEQSKFFSEEFKRKMAGEDALDSERGGKGDLITPRNRLVRMTGNGWDSVEEEEEELRMQRMIDMWKNGNANVGTVGMGLAGSELTRSKKFIDHFRKMNYEAYKREGERIVAVDLSHFYKRYGMGSSLIRNILGGGESRKRFVNDVDSMVKSYIWSKERSSSTGTSALPSVRSPAAAVGVGGSQMSLYGGLMGAAGKPRGNHGSLSSLSNNVNNYHNNNHLETSGNFNSNHHKYNNNNTSNKSYNVLGLGLGGSTGGKIQSMGVISTESLVHSSSNLNPMLLSPIPPIVKKPKRMVKSHVLQTE
jgi:hypothetical protein